MFIRFQLLGFVLLAAVSTAAQAEVVTLAPVSDNTLFEDATGALSNGAGQYLFAGRTNQPDGQSLRRAVLKFDVAAALPSGATIVDVALTMNMSRTIEGATVISLHRVLADWGEGTSDATGEEGTGAPSAANDATWLHRFFNTAAWTSAGGDFSATESAIAIVIGLGTYTWASTPALLADVEQWRTSPASNFGWLALGEESFTGSAKRFDSRETPNPADRPSLRIVYTVPVPAASTWGLVAMSMMLAIFGTVLLRRQPVAA